ncbi:hypothetical protein EON79_05745 [bacterium]|nr:MAG: hypothetical protein EON79_05745 [bacterium]
MLPGAFGLLLAVLGTISFLIGWHGARVELGEREIVASWAGKTRRFRYEEIVAIYEPGPDDGSDTVFVIRSRNAHIRLPKVMQGEPIESLVRKAMDDRGLGYAKVALGKPR